MERRTIHIPEPTDEALALARRSLGRVGEPGVDRPVLGAVDFDGTLCVEEWPEIGAPNVTGLLFWRQRQADGHQVALWTCRSGLLLQEALDWSRREGLVYDLVCANCPDRTAAYNGADPRKIGADLYVDDRAFPGVEVLDPAYGPPGSSWTVPILRALHRRFEALASAPEACRALEREACGALLGGGGAGGARGTRTVLARGARCAIGTCPPSAPKEASDDGS